MKIFVYRIILSNVIEPEPGVTTLNNILTTVNNVGSTTLFIAVSINIEQVTNVTIFLLFSRCFLSFSIVAQRNYTLTVTYLSSLHISVKS